MQRAGVESILGLGLQGDVLLLGPCVPKSWPCFELSLRHGSAQYEITLENPNSVGRGVVFAALDESVVADRLVRLRLVDDGAMHRLRVWLG
jgi:cyclic beta-1,2-glucan synthetase